MSTRQGKTYTRKKTSTEHLHQRLIPKTYTRKKTSTEDFYRKKTYTWTWMSTRQGKKYTRTSRADKYIYIYIVLLYMHMFQDVYRKPGFAIPGSHFPPGRNGSDCKASVSSEAHAKSKATSMAVTAQIQAAR